MKRSRGGIFIALILLISGGLTGCKTAGQIMEIAGDEKLPNEFRVDGNQLIFEGTMVSRARQPVELYRVMNDGTSGGRRVAYARGLRGNVPFHLAGTPIARGKRGPSSRQTIFTLPASAGNPDGCYMVVSGQQAVRHGSLYDQSFALTVDKSDFLINLKPYFLRRKVESQLDQALRDQNTATRTVFETERAINDALHRVKNEHKFSNGQCVRLKPSMPPEPAGLIDVGQARNLAWQIYIEHLVDKYDCTAAVQVARLIGGESKAPRQLADAGDWICNAEALAGAFGLLPSDTAYSKIISRDELSGLADLLELGLSTCAFDSERWGCSLFFGLTVVGRAIVNVDELENRLLEPRRRWEAAIARARSSAEASFKLCKSDVKLAADANALLGSAIFKAHLAGERVNELEAQLRSFGEDRTLSGRDLQC